jgi:uncharacterized protein (TIGR00725 family)
MPRSPKNRIRRIAVLGRGRVLEKDPIYQQALKLGQALARSGFCICHGGYGGVMEAAAKGARLGGGQNTGVTIRGSSKKTNPYVSAELSMPSWQSRLFKLVEMGDAYIFLDGATGTLAEFFVVLEMSNRKLIKKPVIILGKKLHKLIGLLKKDPHFDIPRGLAFATSVAQAMKYLRGYRG